LNILRFEMWKKTIKLEKNLKIFKEEFEKFLPEKILDFHIHICPKQAVPTGSFAINAGGNKLKKYTFDELKEDMCALYPNREFYGVCFGVPSVNLKTDIMNNYVASVCDKKNFFPLKIVRPEENEKEIEEDIIKKEFYGFKPYRDYAEKFKKKEEVEILDFLPEKILKIADKYGLIIMLHIPKKDRLADKSNQKQFMYICDEYPDAKIVLAHIGRAYYFKNIYGNLEKIKKFPNLYFDLAMVNNFEVIEYLFENVVPDKILYGTDIPIALAEGKSVEINDQYTYITPIPWELSISDEKKKIVFTSFVYEEIRAIKKAVERTKKDINFIKNLFFYNGYKLLKEVKIK